MEASRENHLTEALRTEHTTGHNRKAIERRQVNFLSTRTAALSPFPRFRPAIKIDQKTI
jgi:hypothetical protein